MTPHAKLSPVSHALRPKCHPQLRRLATKGQRLVVPIRVLERCWWISFSVHTLCYCRRFFILASSSDQKTTNRNFHLNQFFFFARLQIFQNQHTTSNLKSDNPRAFHTFLSGLYLEDSGKLIYLT